MKDAVGYIKRKNIPFYAEEQAFIRFVDRVTDGKYGDKVCFSVKDSKSGFDEYVLSANAGIIYIKATSGAAGGAAINRYLKKYCRYYYGILTKSGELPDVPPDTDGVIEEKSAFHYRYAFNYCTFGYSYAFNDWTDWERITNYLILSGYNLVLNPIGNECVWSELLQKFGYTREEAKKYISAPNYLPWQWMMNLSAFQSEYFDPWFEKQRQISVMFNAKLKSFGMSAVLPGYCGAVPDDFGSRFPSASVVSQGEWCGFTRPAILLPENDLFPKIAKEYYNLQKELLGSKDMHFYSADPFHEGGEKGDIDLAEYALRVLQGMRQVDKDAVWAFQGWQANPDRKILSALKKEDVLIMNLQGDGCPDGNDDFMGYPHIYCVVNNFGGEQAMRGSAEKTYLLSHAMAKNENSACVGIGIMPEGVECDEVLFDVISEVSVRDSLLPTRDFLREYIEARYGKTTEALTEAYETLFEKIYVSDIVAYPHESGLIARPTPNVNRVCRWAGAAKAENDGSLVGVAKTLLQYYDDFSRRQSYVKDLVAVLRQLIANESWKYIYGLNEAFAKGDKEDFDKNSKNFLELFSLQEAVVDCDGQLNLQNYLDKAAKRGTTEREKVWLTENAKRLITLWGEEKGSVLLHDYAAREYGDMLRYFYKPRWKKYLTKCKHLLEKGDAFDEYDRYADEIEFVNENREYSRKVETNLRETAEKVLKRFDFDQI